MEFFRSWRRTGSGLALVAMLGLALAPTVSRALTADGPRNPFTEICSAADRLQSLPLAGTEGGAVRVGLASAAVDVAIDLEVGVPVDAPPGGSSGGAVGHPLDHCPLCALAGGQPLLPGADPAAAPLLDGADVVPAPLAPSPRPRLTWAAAQARAPPSSV